jgi:adenine-specific DNA-methyltransferase
MKTITLEKFQSLLRELFQFDCADLDFGIYRIMNLKRAVIERFIAEDLPKEIAEELQRGAFAEQERAQQTLKEVRQKLLDVLGEDALDANGNLAEKYRETRAGREYLEAQAKAAGSRSTEALEADIYNHLYAFFSRYWQDGDFISRRRYSKKERYAIPYNGEEVYLYWANHDQYYVKTGEYFTDYTYQPPNGVTVHFKLRQADVEQNNVKGEKRFFLPVLGGIAWDEAARALTIPFEYRPLTEQEAIAYGQKNQQESIIAKAVAEIPKRVKAAEALDALTRERRKTENGETVTYLEHHLRQYTRRNTSDFFIHKDLRGFLSRELDFYLKNEVLNLDELEAAGEDLAEGWFQLLRLIKRIGGRIIEFLAQIEDFQKALWEKKKFVTETFYVVTVGNIPEAFYPEIAACEAQWEEWEQLGMVNAECRKMTAEERSSFLMHHSSLPLDTRHFPQEFTDRLLASFDDLDEMTDGLLVHSENWQALNLLQEKYRERVKCAHIDPPYNTQTSGFLYKNDYQHSSWLAMMENRLFLGWQTTRRDGSFACHIDENEYEALHFLSRHLGIPVGGTVVWDKRNPMLGRKGIATQHEYVLWLTALDSPVYLRPENVRMILQKAQEIIKKHGVVNEAARREFATWIRNTESLSGGEKAYCLLDDDGRVFQSVSMEAPEPRTDSKFFVPLIHPVTKKACPVPRNGWSRSPETINELLEKGEVLFGKDETIQPRRKVFLTDKTRRQLSSVISDSSRGKNDVDKLGLEFPYCHPVSLYEDLIGAGTDNHDDFVLDFFAGSGTTGHAVINLNREDGGRRKFILVEMAHYFDTVLLPRIKKVTFTPEWKDGKPKRMATAEEAARSPRLVKVIRLESYEDALNNLTFDEESGQQARLRFGEEYLLSYMLRWETRHSETLLNVEQLQSPFSYQLHLHRDGETREQPVDLPETFAYLLGLDVQTRKVYRNDERRMMNDESHHSSFITHHSYLVYRGALRDGRSVAVIWRETKGWTTEDYRRDAAFVSEQKLAEGADEVWVNGDALIPGARSLDPIFKERMMNAE